MGKVKRIAFLGLMQALILILAVLEHMLPPLPFMPPGVRIGLANVVVMYVLFFVGGKEAFALNIVKSGFVFLTRGAVAAALSFSGGVLSLCVLLLLVKLAKARASYIMLSVASAIAHNIGQMLVFMVITRTPAIVYYLPFLLIFGVILGIITGVILKILFNKIRGGYL
ncbi:MAG: Gx transporter family protein [Clostridiales bacterium]|jgi:heptaprenyl diphosphate synthase|nr:Gx transporter family protein [Clostridiales bacterium]